MLAALRYRNRTGKGQCVELPQIESVVNGLGTAVVDYLANGEIQPRIGNRSLTASPHGAFRCADDPTSANSPDRWVAIACRDDTEWSNLCEALGQPATASDPRFATFDARKSNEDELEAIVNSWLRDRRAEDVMVLLQSRGVPCGVVQNAQDLLDKDQHIRAREYYKYLDHAEIGRSAYDGPAMLLSRTPGFFRAPAPLLGEHTMDVCERIIGLSSDEVADLLADGVLI
jgi:benzylsuccinate CoA-transferase BbsF subunit